MVQATPLPTGLDFVKYDRGQRYISIFLNHSIKTEWQNFRCVNCGKLAFKYKNPLELIFDGHQFDSTRPLEIICTKCDTLYIVD